MSEPTGPRPSLDLLRGFEAAARHLNFTRAADEMALTQSAVSRQIKALEDRLGVQLVVRQARGIALTEEGERLYRAVAAALSQVHAAIEQISSGRSARTLTVSCTLSFCSLWLIPRLASFQSAHPGVEVRLSANNHVINLDRERIDLAIRYCSPASAPAGAIRLFGEEVLPVCSPALLEPRGRELTALADLRNHVLLHLDDPSGPIPWVSWPSWLEAAGLPALRTAGSLYFNHYEQVVRAAVGGQGIALGRMPLVDSLLQDGSLVAPFHEGIVTDRAYWLVQSQITQNRAEVSDFVAWVIREGQSQAASPGLNPEPRRAQRKTKLRLNRQGAKDAK